MKTELAICLLFTLPAFAAEPSLTTTNTTENPKTETWATKAAPTKPFAVNLTTNSAPCWRLIHDGANLIYVPWYGGSQTATKKNLVTAKPLDEVKKYIVEKKLKVTNEQQAEIDMLTEPGEKPKEPAKETK